MFTVRCSLLPSPDDGSQESRYGLGMPRRSAVRLQVAAVRTFRLRGQHSNAVQKTFVLSVPKYPRGHPTIQIPIPYCCRGSV